MFQLKIYPKQIKLTVATKIKAVVKQTIVGFLAFSLVACGGQGQSASKATTPVLTLSVSDALEEVRSFHQVPAVAGIYIANSEIIESAAVGNKAAGQPERVTEFDKWHLGSITKSFTATLAAKLIELNYLQWQTTIAEIFPDWPMQNYFKTVTVEQLLTHTGGVESDLTKVVDWASYYDSALPILEQRANMAKSLLSLPPENQQKKFIYSNSGFVVVGAMLEAIMGQSWESLLTDYVLTPLDINDAGFGAPSDGFDYSQPYGHLKNSGVWQPIAPTDIGADNPAAIGPAGTLHMSLQSLAKYAIAHLEGESGQSEFLTQSTFKKLHQPQPNSNYAMGWFVDAHALSHDGSNTLWFAKIGLDLEQNIAVIAFTNVGGDDGNQVTDNVINTLLLRNHP